MKKPAVVVHIGEVYLAAYAIWGHLELVLTFPHDFITFRTLPAALARGVGSAKISRYAQIQTPLGPQAAPCNAIGIGNNEPLWFAP
jgi:hypothetical protein